VQTNPGRGDVAATNVHIHRHVVTMMEQAQLRNLGAEWAVPESALLFG